MLVEVNVPKVKMKLLYKEQLIISFYQKDGDKSKKICENLDIESVDKNFRLIKKEGIDWCNLSNKPIDIHVLNENIQDVD